MDAFESVVAEVLWRDGYWVQNAVKVDLTKEDKSKINRPSSPRWELDIVGYSGQRGEGSDRGVQELPRFPWSHIRSGQG